MSQQIALVTGAAQGIGLACAETLVEEGRRVVMVDVAADPLAAAADRLGCAQYVCDMGAPEQIDDLFERIESEHGVVSVLVNNAGVAAPDDFMAYAIDDFRRVLDVNLIGVFAATQRAAKTMIAQGVKGSIINMSSINAQVAIATIPAYCASKGGVMQLTKSAALALAPHGVRVNAVGPGSIDTAMAAAVNADPEAMRRVLSRTPLGRIGDAREVANVVSFLASEKASYITGETIYVDGGRLGLNYTV